MEASFKQKQEFIPSERPRIHLHLNKTATPKTKLCYLFLYQYIRPAGPASQSEAS